LAFRVILGLSGNNPEVTSALRVLQLKAKRSIAVLA
jgi:hypothetical protein